ncbi:hypothetical protein ABZ816_36190 [Actinosynnema sp. NPDC047251]|uniref:Uncharacterized protein n=1 Tax=Saccharothrix espanaensis (strain ATCC 51144 / DSM 44229 / JCM 9112 / NBRC 15066 / NRRL 15764) TaxID=1179773 RepID=K0JY14_SACES|nr:hypothetical protein [Saccharothrix espanaensis]CCH29073.1 hypothetical protein BN6_17520 [Saccharothrix espanaensis DSM 44229]
MTDRLTTDDFVPPEKRGTHHDDDVLRDGHPDTRTDDVHPDAHPNAHTDAHTGVHGENTHTDDRVVENDSDAVYDEPADFDREPAADTALGHNPDIVPVTAPAAEPATAEQGARSDDEPLFGDTEAEELRTEWRGLQADFVDDPQDAVQRADELVAQVIGSLANTFAEHRRSLEEQWKQEGHADTEELRVALRRYRTFFDRLLSV